MQVTQTTLTAMEKVVNELDTITFYEHNTMAHKVLWDMRNKIVAIWETMETEEWK